jgi:hypothetical protein
MALGKASKSKAAAGDLSKQLLIDTSKQMLPAASI